MSQSVPRLRVASAALALLVLGAAGAIAAPKAYVHPMEIDLGVVEEGKTFERYVEVKNVGDGVLVLEDMKPTCGCTVAALDGAVELKAGQSQKVRLTFSTKNMDGSVRKTVLITTNDPEQRNFEVALVADVHRPVRFVPKFLELRDVNMRDAWEESVRLESDAPLGLKIREAYVLGGRLRNEPSKLFDVEAKGPRRQGDRDVYDFAVRLRTPAKPQNVSEILVIVTDRPAPDDTLRVVLRGEVLGRIRASTSFIVLKSVDPGETTRHDVTLEASEGTFKVVRAQVPDSDVEVKTYPSEGGRQAVLSLTYRGKEPGANGVRTLIVETDDPEQKLVEIPVRYQTRAETKTNAAAKPASNPPAAGGKKGK